MNEWLRSAPNAVDLAHAVLPQKHAQLRGHFAEAEAELGRAATKGELVLLREIDLCRLPVDRSGRLENEQVVVEGGVEIVRREAHFVLRHHSRNEAGSELENCKPHLNQSHSRHSVDFRCFLYCKAACVIASLAR